MQKSQIIILVIAIIAVIFLFNLPKVLVKDDRQADAGKTQNQSHTETNEEVHNLEISENDQKKLNDLRKSYLSVSDNEKKIKFADSLATLFRKVNKYDSSARYIGEIASLKPEGINQIKAGDAYFDAATFALDQKKSKDLGDKARDYYLAVLEKEPGNLQVKTKVAKTYFGNGDPQNTMKGVQLLKEVIKEDPQNEEALFSLGQLSIQSQQFDKAVERFEVIAGKNPEHLEAQFWLGYSYMKLGEKKQARKAFENTKKLSDDPEVLATVDAYLKELK